MKEKPKMPKPRGIKKSPQPNKDLEALKNKSPAVPALWKKANMLIIARAKLTIPQIVRHMTPNKNTRIPGRWNK